MLFARGTRPRASDIAALAKDRGEFSISFDPGRSAREDPHAPVWLEVLASGLTFDLTGLAPGPAADCPPQRQSLALDQDDLHALEALTLAPGPHLSGGAGMMPIIRTLAALGASLAQLEGVRAVAWHTSRCWSEPSVYRDGVQRWIDGGVFPALTLTSLIMSPDGGMQSEGLVLMTGQELRLEPEIVGNPAEAAKLAVRLLDHLIERGRVEVGETISGPDGESLRLEPSQNSQFVRVCRG